MLPMNNLDHGVTIEKAEKPSDISPVTMKALASPSTPFGISEYLSRSRMAAKVTIASAQPKAASETIDHRFLEIIAPLDHEQAAAQNGAIDGDQRQEDSERPVKPRREPVERHLQDLHHGGDYADEAHKLEESQIHIRQSCPGPGALESATD
jgi:hypothetical protein